MTTTVAILAGGLATRLGAITQTIPKALLEVAGRPFIAHQLDLLRAHGMTRVVLCVAHLADQIEAVVGDGRAWGLDVAYARDDAAAGTLLGTGGALRQALPLLGERFLVMYGDSYLQCDYRAVVSAFTASGKLGLMTVFHNDGRYDRSNVRFSDGRILRYDKTPGVPDLTHIDWGLGAFAAEAFAEVPAGTRVDLAAIFQDLLARGQLVGYEVHERFYEIGSEAGLAETRALLSRRTEQP